MSDVNSSPKFDVSYVRQSMDAAMPPPASESGVIGWMRKNLFSGVTNTIFTLIAIWLIYMIVPGFLQWSLFDAVWSGTDRLACATVLQGGQLPADWSGACWPYIGSYSKLFLYGRYPIEELWRPNLVFAVFAIGLVPLLIPSIGFKKENLLFMLGIFPLASFILLLGGNLSYSGFLLPNALMEPSVAKFWVDYLILTAVICGIAFGLMRATDSNPLPAIRATLVAMAILGIVLWVASVDFSLEEVETDKWGGLLLTMVVAITGIVVSLPLGIVLALGRQSEMPIVRLFSIIFIEGWRGVPLITVLFMSSVLLPLFLPDGVTFDKLLRALIGVALFSAAYMAEVVRGGLQAIPKGQYEGAMAVGLSYWQSMRMIILPQALKIVIPGIVNTFIGLFKDTTLVSIIGLFDVLGMINSSHSDPKWATPVQALTSYLFGAAVFWVFCFMMSRYSIFMERKLDTGHKS
jgi:general L-amino acid transport system permease protein